MFLLIIINRSMISLKAVQVYRRVLVDGRRRCIGTTPVQFDGSKDDSDAKSAAAKKLNSLLESIIKEEATTPKVEPKIEVPKPRVLHRQKKAAAAAEKAGQPQNLGEKIVVAAKDVAKTIGGDLKKNEAELLHKLLYKNTTSLSGEITKAASDNASLSDLIKGMKIDQETPSKRAFPGDHKKMEKVRAVLKKYREISTRDELENRRKIDLFGGPRLGIFNSKSTKDNIVLSTWDKCVQRDIRLSVTQSPSNIYEQMILWTEKGILWKFPIDNEQGLEDEKQVYFAEHVFLETHLEDWCPSTGPIRHFMELVCVGLSRNYWLTADEKKQHLLWYKEYFSSKKDLIKELGAGEIANAPMPSPT